MGLRVRSFYCFFIGFWIKKGVEMFKFLGIVDW